VSIESALGNRRPTTTLGNAIGKHLLRVHHYSAKPVMIRRDNIQCQELIQATHTCIIHYTQRQHETQTVPVLLSLQNSSQIISTVVY